MSLSAGNDDYFRNHYQVRKLRGKARATPARAQTAAAGPGTGHRSTAQTAPTSNPGAKMPRQV